MGTIIAKVCCDDGYCLAHSTTFIKLELVVASHKVLRLFFAPLRVWMRLITASAYNIGLPTAIGPILPEN